MLDFFYLVAPYHYIYSQRIEWLSNLVRGGDKPFDQPR